MNNIQSLTQMLTTAASREPHLLHELHQVLEMGADDLGCKALCKGHDLETLNTPWKINMIHQDTPKNGGLEDDVPFRRVIFRFLTVCFRYWDVSKLGILKK